MTSLGRWCAVWLLVFCAVAYSAPLVRDDREAVDRLVEQFAPQFHFHPEERWLPDDVDTFLANVRLQISRDDIVPLDNGQLPTGPDTKDYHIIAELPRGVGTQEVEYQPFLAGKGPEEVPVYVTVTRCDSPSSEGEGDPDGVARPSFHATYWTFHPFNEGKWALGQMRGNHVGDWEHVSIQVQEGELKEIYVSAHEFGAYYVHSPQSNTFNFTKSTGSLIFSQEFVPTLALDGTHPVLYVALGSHGLWPAPGEHHYGRVSSLKDVTAEGGAIWRSWRRLVPLDRSPPAWLQYAGRWGNPADCSNIIKAFCELGNGPRGVAGRRADFQCGKRTQRSWWRDLFGRRRRRRSVAGVSDSN